MDFKLQNLRDTAYNRQVCEDAVEMYGKRRFSWKIKDNGIWISIKDMAIDEYRNFLHYLK